MIGTHIKHYLIKEKKAEGGMGIVYQAMDLKLNRTVALKFLPLELTSDQEAVNRFINEAQITSALDHTNICTIYEIDETKDGQLFICMAYYEGETLEQKIKRGVLSVNEAVNVAKQIACGLERVHEAGITHRDLKPTNVMVTHRGEVKILDFGIAKLAGVSQLTKTGSTLGTLAYMSPEQVQKQTVDYRTDIWSLGVVFYEMITGKLPFQAEHEAAMIYSIVNENPEPIPATELEISEGIKRIISKALDKNPMTRYQNVSELIEDLSLEQQGNSELIKPPKLAKRKINQLKKSGIFISLFFLIATFAIVYFTLNRQRSRHILPTPEQVTFSGEASWPALSPDGQFIAYASGKTNDQRIIVQDLTSGQSLDISPELRFLGSLEWSPNSAELSFRGMTDSASVDTYIIPRFGGSARRIPAAFYVAWSPDGKYIANANSNWNGLRIINKATNHLVAVISFNVPFRWLTSLEWSPLSDRFLILTEGDNRYTIWTIKVDGSGMEKVVEDSRELFTPCWAAHGRAVYYLRAVGRTKQLMKIGISAKSGRATSKPEIIRSGMEVGGIISNSSDNKRLFYTRETKYSNLWLVNLNDNNAEQSFQPIELTTGTMAYFDPRISPDGQKITFSLAKGPEADIFVMPIEGGQKKQLTFMNSYNTSPCWSPNGREIAFASQQKENAKLWKIEAGGGTPMSFNASNLSSYRSALTWAPCLQILYHQPGFRNFSRLDPQTEKELPLVQDESIGWIFSPRYSPDGKKVALYRIMQFDESETGLWTISPEDSSQRLIHTAPLHPIAWSEDGKWIYAWNIIQNPCEALMVRSDGRSSKTVFTLPVDEIDGIDITPDRKHLIYAAVEKQSDIWVMENFDPENELDAPINVPEFPEYKQLAYLQKGGEYRKQGKYGDAEQVYVEGLDLNQKNLELLQQLGRCQLNQKKFKESEKAFRQGLKIDPENVYIHSDLGWSLFRQRKYDEARGIFLKALALDPKNVECLWRLGFTLLRQSKYTEAEDFFLKSLALFTKNPHCLNGLISLKIETQNYESAQLYAEKYTELAPNYSNGYLRLGKIHLLQKNYPLAEKTLQQALNLDSDNDRVYAELSYLNVLKQRYESALKFAQKAVSLDSGFVNQNLLGWILVAGEIDFEQGIIIAEKALGSRSDNWARTATNYPYYALPEHTLGLAFLKQKNYEKAAPYLEQAAAFAPTRDNITRDLQLVKNKLLTLSKK